MFVKVYFKNSKGDVSRVNNCILNIFSFMQEKMATAYYPRRSKILPLLGAKAPAIGTSYIFETVSDFTKIYIVL